MQRDKQAGEIVVAEWGTVTLTSARVINSWSRGSTGASTALQLSRVEHTSFVREETGILLFVGLACCVLSMPIMLSEETTVVGAALLCVGLILIAVYFGTRSVEVSIGAGQGLVAVKMTGAGADRAKEAIEFLDRVDVAAYTARVNELAGR